MADPIRDFKGTDTGEWAIENGDFAVIAGAEAVPQGIRVRLGLFLGEAYLAEEKGVPYLDDDATGQEGILGKSVDPLFVRGVLGEAIADTPDVTNVESAQLVVDADREATIEYSVDSVYSEAPFSASVGVP